MCYHIVASELKDPICHSDECQIGSFSSEATIYIMWVGGRRIWTQGALGQQVDTDVIPLKKWGIYKLVQKCRNHSFGRVTVNFIHMFSNE